MRNILKDALKKQDFAEDAAVLAKAAAIIRKDIFSHQSFKFTGHFPPKCQEEKLPSSHKSLISMILNGPNLKDQDKRELQACLTIGLGIFYNTKKNGSSTAGKTRHASHLFQCTLASMFMRRPGARKSSNSYTRWVSASHMTEL